MKRLLLSLLLVVAASATAIEVPKLVKADPAKGQATAAGICVACHAADGNSLLTANPKLAGQHADYLYKQLTEFKSGVRNNAVMLGMSAALSDEDMRNVAAWFESQKQTGSQTKNRDTVLVGQKIYRAGISEKGVAACAGCHGPTGSGIPAQYPRIGGQHADYTEAQLKAFRIGGTDVKDSTGRANDPNKMMRMTAAKLSDYEIKAVADYIAGLR